MNSIYHRLVQVNSVHLIKVLTFLTGVLLCLAALAVALGYAVLLLSACQVALTSPIDIHEHAYSLGRLRDSIDVLALVNSVISVITGVAILISALPKDGCVEFTKNTAKMVIAVALIGSGLATDRCAHYIFGSYVECGFIAQVAEIAGLRFSSETEKIQPRGL